MAWPGRRSLHRAIDFSVLAGGNQPTVLSVSEHEEKDAAPRGRGPRVTQELPRHVRQGHVPAQEAHINGVELHRAEPQGGDPIEQIKELFAEFEQRIAAAEERAAAAEERLSLWQQDWDRKWTSARIWVITLLVWNAVLTGLAIYLAVARR